ncbi:MAG: HipA N-terminal domain-containing protein [Bacteroidetes bacterium]|nr:HipA N-terminal domain-containing protein [Bacteroidota bacterium]
MRSAEIRINEHAVGRLTETDNGYEFGYYTEWLENPEAQPISLTLPLSHKLYISNIMFPFFDGLIPEGWLLEIAEKNWKLNPRDRMGLLLACCKDCIGAVSVYPLEEEKE